MAANKLQSELNADEKVFPGFQANVLKRVYGEHFQHHVQHPAQAGRQKAPREAGAEDGRSANFLISDAVESYIADQERLRAEIQQSTRQVESGHYVRHEDMKAWLLSWGTDHELPPPKCVCGKVHDDEALCR